MTWSETRGWVSPRKSTGLFLRNHYPFGSIKKIRTEHRKTEERINMSFPSATMVGKLRQQIQKADNGLKNDKGKERVWCVEKERERWEGRERAGCGLTWQLEPGMSWSVAHTGWRVASVRHVRLGTLGLSVYDGQAEAEPLGVRLRSVFNAESADRLHGHPAQHVTHAQYLLQTYFNTNIIHTAGETKSKHKTQDWNVWTEL